MLTLSTQAGPVNALPLGSFVDVHLEKGEAGLETRAFLRQRPILYTRPLRDWTAAAEPLIVFPESPGHYAVEVEWRDGDRSGWARLAFTIVAPDGQVAMPTKAQIGGRDLWAPSAWEARVFVESERSVDAQIRALIGEGDVVYDLGANVGFYASLFARACGESGHVYCVEANPICIQMLRSNILSQDLAHVDILPVAVLHHEGVTRFTLNYGNSNLGVSEASGFYPLKTGHQITVPCLTVDQLIERFALRPPDVVKLDVEGAEAYVVEGMERALTDHRPRLLMELHGLDCASAVLERLGRFGYAYSDPETGKAVDAQRASQRKDVFQLVARPVG